MSLPIWRSTVCNNRRRTVLFGTGGWKPPVFFVLSSLFSFRLKVGFRFFLVVLFIKILSVLLSVFLSSATLCFNLCFILFYTSFGFHFFCVPFPPYVLGGHLRHEQYFVMPVEYVRAKTVNIRSFFVLALFAEAFRRGGYVGGFYPCAEDVIEISGCHVQYIAQTPQLGIVQEGLSVLFVGLVLTGYQRRNDIAMLPFR